MLTARQWVVGEKLTFDIAAFEVGEGLASRTPGERWVFHRREAIHCARRGHPLVSTEVGPLLD